MKRDIFVGQGTTTAVICKTLHVICKPLHMLYVIIVSTLHFAGGLWNPSRCASGQALCMQRLLIPYAQFTRFGGGEQNKSMDFSERGSDERTWITLSLNE